jgi:hypothetical protein
VLAERGFRYIDGYKPRGNYQRSLADALDRQLAMLPWRLPDGREASTSRLGAG